MLVKFNSDAGALITFGDVARKLLRMMGQTGDVPGALLAQDVPAALERLRSAVALAPGLPDDAAAATSADEPPVSMRQRAFPLIELLARAAKRDCDVLWEEERSLIR
ncbi:MAG: DUF1840 domain-containing protein [Betaproteobacteria bacterium]|nr:DUF1840 domain-containing protein [Betaproteobacteria bacterium]